VPRPPVGRRSGLVHSGCSRAIDVLEKNLGDQRDAAFDKAARAVDSDRYRALGLKTALWIVDGDWSRSSDPMLAAKRDRPALDLIAEILTKRLKKILMKAEKVAELSPRGRHKLRIAVKKLRYAHEFFASLFPGRKRAAKRQRLSGALKSLQSALGRLNDTEAHKRIAGAIAQPRKRVPQQAQQALAIGVITGQEQVETRSLLTAATEAADRLAKAKVFWEAAPGTAPEKDRTHPDRSEPEQARTAGE
jgi:triphosphatase